MISVNSVGLLLAGTLFLATFLLLRKRMLPRPLNGLGDWIFLQGVPKFASGRFVLGGLYGAVLVRLISRLGKIKYEGGGWA